MQLLRAAVRPRPRIARLDYSGHALFVDVASPAVAHSRLRPVAKEPWTVAWLESSLEEGDVLWDVGANIGGYSLIAAAAGASRVVAVEPAAANFAALCDNISLNRFESVIVPLPVVLADRTALLALDEQDRRAGATHRLAAGGGAGRQVLGFALDDLISRFQLPSPALLKLDVDGAEPLVLQGAASTLASPGLRSLLIEVEARAEAEVLAATAAAGFRVAERFTERDGVTLNGVWYGIFTRSPS